MARFGVHVAMAHLVISAARRAQRVGFLCCDGYRLAHDVLVTHLRDGHCPG